MNPFYKIVSWYFKKNSLPYWCIFLFDCFLMLLSGIFSYWLFNKTNALVEHRFNVLNTLLIYIALSWVGFRLFHTYSGIVRYSSFVDLTKVAWGNLVGLVLSVVVMYLLDIWKVPEVGILSLTETCLTFFIATLMMWASRILVKTLYDVTFSDKRAMRVLIYGAMSGGVGLAKMIRSQTPRKFQLCGFISHDEHAKHFRLMGEKVYSTHDDFTKIIKDKGIEGILVSPLRIQDFQNNQELQDIFIGAGLKIFLAQVAKEMNVEGTESNMNDLQLKEVSVEDLLPREEISVDLKSVEELLTGKKVLITGAAGSIGSEMVRQVAKFKPAAMVLIDQAETPQHDIRLMMAKDFPEVKAETIVTSISRQNRMDALFRTFRPDYVFHAAAYKHVPMMEDNPSEAVLNNIYGTKVIADMAVKYGVKKFVMISTDKAVNPTNVMGCSKRICEIYVQSLDRKLKLEQMKNKQSEPLTQFVTTRFGNVLGSNGSVIPLFKEQIKNGGPVTVTHPDIIRFFMLIPEACKLVLEAGTKGNGGEIFVFDMGKPVRIADLAARMIKLSGAKNVKIEYTGLREGEKLYEEVLSEAENTKPTFHKKIRIAQVREYDYEQAAKDIDELIAISKEYDDMATVKKMKEIVPEFKSNNSKYEQLD
ncbi:nucleoside-diphosphate sugar epimerase/dehydratase [Prevotella sp. tf2-5]|uniref:polysaccharide biosynthesis protein n=1 Tax=Prevotella sp. tf2-5 TaxID=1761889 RepID=UPI0008ED54F8|nr:nucleoside-diphosphate sugar epimerase/dehydratase [Prevotella sp. tf2-5]SFO88175.1 NDP-sugar epimerase, includes UDP-GlcNAc-inverting 4,6-dehydratase FlaA1 and capsular polysaccharide biosynthesis protein EpsC [Prevotella sp. tf2-5]